MARIEYKQEIVGAIDRVESKIDQQISTLAEKLDNIGKK